MSGGASFTAYVSIKQTRPGEAKHAISVVLGVDHYLKLVVIVDDDIDVFDESDVLWAMATRVQPDRDLVIISGSLGAILDPSASPEGLTAKLGIDATRAFGEAGAEKLRHVRRGDGLGARPGRPALARLARRPARLDERRELRPPSSSRRFTDLPCLDFGQPSEIRAMLAAGATAQP